MPSAATRPAALLALLPSFTRRISSAFTRSPAASVRAFLHSIIGASVFSRSSFTMPAVISAMNLLLMLSVCNAKNPDSKKGALRPLLDCRGSARAFFSDFDQFFGLHHFLDHLALAFQDGVGYAARIKSNGTGRV